MLNVKPTLYSAFSTDAMLPGMVPGGFHPIKNSDGGIYPAVVYSEISNVPALNADGEEQYSKVTVQISILTDGTSTSAIAERINIIMLSLGFARQFSGDLIDGKISMKILRYTIAG